MGKSLGTSAGIVALIAVLIHLSGASGTERTSPGGLKESANGLRSAVAVSKDAPSIETHGPWRATQQYFHRDPETYGAGLDGCLGNLTSTCLQRIVALYAFPEDFNFQNIHSVIATVPDPLHTRMAMETDRCLDAIQQAAFHSGYEMASQWLPWTEKIAADKTHAGDVDSGDTGWEKLPGLIVFRPHFRPHTKDVNSLLLVFIIGETPTSGINGFQFEIARGSILALDARQPHELDIAGPNFSGSFESLTRLLQESPANVHVEVRAGSASNSMYAEEMLIDLKGNGFTIGGTEDSRPPSITFYGSTLPSIAFQHDFKTLADRLGLSNDQVAEIIEDETGFSFQVEGFRTYRYPRDIAQLRNAYNDSALASLDSEAKPTSSVDFSLKDSQSGEDSFPAFSTNHTPISQNAVVQQIAAHLRHSSVRLVSLSATSVFDKLFLANVLAQSCPDTRVVVRGADLLFVQEALKGSLSGIMAISSFPLFPEATDLSQRATWANERADVTTFASSDQIAEFNAVFSLLARFGDFRNDKDRRGDATSAAEEVGSAWLLVLSPRGWMPVDFGSRANGRLEVNGQSVQWFDPHAASPADQQPLAVLLRVGPGWVILCALVAGFSLAFCFRLFYLRWQPHRRVWSALDMSDMPPGGHGRGIRDILQNRYFCMTGCFASLAAANGLLLCPMLVCLENGSLANRREELTAALVAAAFLACSVISLWLALLVEPPRRYERGNSFRLAALLLAAGSICVWWTCCNNGVPGYMLCFRTLTLASPVSPIWPPLLVVSGLFALSYFHLRRFTWGDRRKPYVDTSVFDEALSNEFQNTKERLETGVISTFGAGGVPPILIAGLVIAGFFLSLWILLPSGSLSSFEPARFSTLLRVLLAVLAFYTLVSLVRFNWCWSLLRAFLANLNSVVLGRYFTRVPEFGGGSGPVWIRGVKLMSLSTAVNSCIALHNLEISQRNHGLYVRAYISHLQKFLAPSDGQTTRADFIDDYEQFRLTACDIAKELSDKILRNYWRNNQLPFVGEPASEDSVLAHRDLKVQQRVATAAVTSKELEGKSVATAVGTLHSLVIESHVPESTSNEAPAGAINSDESPSSEAYEQAAKYVALHYSAYVGYMLHQLQNLLLCCMVCFVLLVAALNSFSFQAPQAIFHLLSVGLIVGGAAILVAFAQMERDPILSRLSGTTEGELGKDFYVRALSFGALPILTVLSSEFPSIGRYLTTWIEPVSAALR